jgi:hypothetical protein
MWVTLITPKPNGSPPQTYPSSDGLRLFFEPNLFPYTSAFQNADFQNSKFLKIQNYVDLVWINSHSTLEWNYSPLTFNTVILKIVSVSKSPFYFQMSITEPAMLLKQECQDRPRASTCASSKSPPSLRSLVGWLVGWLVGTPVTLHTYSPVKMEQTKFSEMLTFKLQTPVKHQEETTQGVI